jgi:hypothetical protein
LVNKKLVAAGDYGGITANARQFAQAYGAARQ